MRQQKSQIDGMDDPAYPVWHRIAGDFPGYIARRAPEDPHLDPFALFPIPSCLVLGYLDHYYISDRTVLFSGQTLETPWPHSFSFLNTPRIHRWCFPGQSATLGPAIASWSVSSSTIAFQAPASIRPRDFPIGGCWWIVGRWSV